MAKVLIINGSPRNNGCTARALEEVEKELHKEGIETETLHVGNKEIRGCTSCRYCFEHKQCVFDDIVNETAPKLGEADGILIGSPVYYSSPNGTLLSFLDRLFYSTAGKYSLHMKVGAAVTSCRRAGNTSSFDVLNKYFSINNMVIAGSNYWNNVHGFTAEDVEKDIEGLQTMRNLGRNMAFMIKAIADAKEKSGLPELDRGAYTCFADGK